MPHIAAPDGVPGIRGLFTFRPETAEPLLALAQALLRGPSPLSALDRELIATMVSSQNECRFCTMSHGAAAEHLPGGSEDLVVAVRRDPETAPVSEKIRALLMIASRVRDGGRSVREEDVSLARAAGASDVEIHDAVLIAAAFCMFNRYVDGLAAITPQHRDEYRAMGERLARHGYVPPRDPR